MFDVKTTAIATIRATRKTLTTQLAAVHADLDGHADQLVGINRDDDREFYKLLGQRDALVTAILQSEKYEQLLQSARPESLVPLATGRVA